MMLLIYSGLLYLLGISIILSIKPKLMFSKDGNWKEFGLGRHPDKYTWMPFWLFTIIWAILSYTIVLCCIDMTYSINNVNNIDFTDMSHQQNNSNESIMKPGYYILNIDAHNTPQYIYLGNKNPISNS